MHSHYFSDETNKRQSGVWDEHHVLVMVYLVYLLFFISLKLKEDEVCWDIVGCNLKQAGLCSCCRHTQEVGNWTGLLQNSPPPQEEEYGMIEYPFLLY